MLRQEAHNPTNYFSLPGFHGSICHAQAELHQGTRPTRSIWFLDLRLADPALVLSTACRGALAVQRMRSRHSWRESSIVPVGKEKGRSSAAALVAGVA
jgi:hypothetical protein